MTLRCFSYPACPILNREIYQDVLTAHFIHRSRKQNRMIIFYLMPFLFRKFLIIYESMFKRCRFLKA